MTSDTHDLPIVQEPAASGAQTIHYYRAPSPSSPSASFTRPLNLRPSPGPGPSTSIAAVRGQTPPFPASPTVFFHHHNHDSSISSPTSLSAPGLLDTPPSGASYAEFIRTWTDAHVARWLADIRCSSYTPVFRENDIRGDILLDLDNTTLKEMGIASIGDRLRIVNGVRVLRQRALGNAGRTTPEPRESRWASSTSTTVLGEEKVDRGSASPQPPPDEDDSSSSGSDNANNDPDEFSLAKRQPSRPAPLQLDSDHKSTHVNVRSGVPSSHASSRGRPLPQPATAHSAASTRGHTRDSSTSRSGLPPLPPAPRGQPPPPPSRSRNPYTPSDRDATATTPGTGLSSSFLTPSTASTTASSTGSSAWSGSQTSFASGSPPTGGGTLSSVEGVRKLGPRSPSPLTVTRQPPPRSSSTHTISGPSSFNHTPQHRKAASQAISSFSDSPVSQSPKMSSSILRPPPPTTGAGGLSPIVETFGSTSAAPSPPSSTMSRQSPYSSPVAERSYHGSPSLDDLKKKHVKFHVPLNSLASNFLTIDVTTCSSGYEVLEKALKKLGRGGTPVSPPVGSPVDSPNGRYNLSPSAATFTPDGGLLIDGWGAYFPADAEETEVVLPDQQPLTDVQILSFCHAPPAHPIREKGLVLKRDPNALSRWDGPSFSPAPDSENRVAFTTNTPMTTTTFQLGSAGLKRRNTKRASAVSVLSGLGVRDPASAFGEDLPAYAAQQPPPPIDDPTLPEVTFIHASPPDMAGAEEDGGEEGRPKKRSFLGNRPPSELITTHLEEFFPFTEKKVLDRTSKARSRQSLMKKRATMMNLLAYPNESEQSGAGGPSGEGTSRASFLSSITPPVPLVPPPIPSDLHTEKPLGTTDPRNKRKSVMISGPPRMSLLPPGDIDKTEGDQKKRKRATRMVSMSHNLTLISPDGDEGVTVDVISAEVENKKDSHDQVATSVMEDDEWTRVDEQGEEEISKEEEEEEEDEEEEEEEETFKWIKGALIGSGSFGKVYLGMDAASGFLMAVKQIDMPEEGASSSALASLEREIDLLRDLQHEKIVQYYYSSMDDEYLNIFLEYVPGGSVTALLRNYGAFEEPLVKNFVRQILEGLNYLHEKGIIHRDIKGGNVLVDNKGGIKISDFGVSKKLEGGTIMSGRGAKNRASLQGSVFWMAPEVVKQTVHTKKADIWSLGCLIVEMLTGDHPWGNLSQMQAIFKIGSGKAQPEIPSDISSDAQDFLEKTFELDYTVRPGASELLNHPWVALKKLPPFFRRGPSFAGS